MKLLRHVVAVTSQEINHNRPIKDKNKMSYGNRGDSMQGQISRRIRNARGRLKELEGTQLRKPAALHSFSGIPHGSHALSAQGSTDDGLLLQLSDAVVADRLRLPSWKLGSEGSVLVTGRNGAGESTLLGVLAGRLALDSGVLNQRKGLRVGLLEQDVRFANPTTSPGAVVVASHDRWLRRRWEGEHLDLDDARVR